MHADRRQRRGGGRIGMRPQAQAVELVDGPGSESLDGLRVTRVRSKSSVAVIGRRR
jgi:hypothetical protein